MSNIAHKWLCESCEDYLSYEIAGLLASFYKDHPYFHKDALFPAPWNMEEFPEKTEGWLEFQREMRMHPNYYKLDWE